MAHTKEARQQVFKLDHGRCQDPECGLAFYPEDSSDGLGYMLQAAHYVHPPDYRGRDRNVFNPDGSRRSRLLCTLHHLDEELFDHENETGAYLLALNQTILTFASILLLDGFDFDIPHGYFSPYETRVLNNERRQKLMESLIRAGAVALRR